MKLRDVYKYKSWLWLSVQVVVGFSVSLLLCYVVFALPKG
jgi:hypothetical protein